MLGGQAGDEVEVRFAGLVDVRQADGGEGDLHQGLQAVLGGDGGEDGAERLVVPAALTLLGQAFAQIGAAGADAQGVRRAAVLQLVHLVGAFVHQPGITPAEPQADGGALGRDGEQPVVVGQLNVELVGLHAAIVLQVDADQAGDDVGGDVVAVDHHAADGVRVVEGGSGFASLLAQDAPSEWGQFTDHSTPRRMSPRAPVRLPSRSTRLSSTRVSLRVNSIRRAAPSRKK